MKRFLIMFIVVISCFDMATGASDASSQKPKLEGLDVSVQTREGYTDITVNFPMGDYRDGDVKKCVAYFGSDPLKADSCHIKDKWWFGKSIRATRCSYVAIWLRDISGKYEDSDVKFVSINGIKQPLQETMLSHPGIGEKLPATQRLPINGLPLVMSSDCKVTVNIDGEPKHIYVGSPEWSGLDSKGIVVTESTDYTRTWETTSPGLYKISMDLKLDENRGETDVFGPVRSAVEYYAYDPDAESKQIQAPSSYKLYPVGNSVSVEANWEGDDVCGYKARFWYFKRNTDTPTFVNEQSIGSDGNAISQTEGYEFVAVQAYDPMGKDTPSPIGYMHLGDSKVKLSGMGVRNPLANVYLNDTSVEYTVMEGAEIFVGDILSANNNLKSALGFPGERINKYVWNVKEPSGSSINATYGDGEFSSWMVPKNAAGQYKIEFYNTPKDGYKSTCFQDGVHSTYTFKTTRTFPDIDIDKTYLEVVLPKDYFLPVGTKVEYIRYNENSLVDIYSVKVLENLRSDKCWYPTGNSIVRMRYIADDYEPGEIKYITGNPEYKYKLTAPEVYVNGVVAEKGAYVKSGSKVEIRNTNIAKGTSKIPDAFVGNVLLSFETETPEDIVYDEKGNVTFTVPESSAWEEWMFSATCSPVTENEEQVFEKSDNVYCSLNVTSSEIKMPNITITHNVEAGSDNMIIVPAEGQDKRLMVRYWFFKPGETTPDMMAEGKFGMYTNYGMYSFVAAQAYDPDGNGAPSRLAFAHFGTEKVKVNNPTVVDVNGREIPSGSTWMAGAKARIKHNNVLHGTDDVDFPTWVIGNREWKAVAGANFVENAVSDGDDFIWIADGSHGEYTVDLYANSKTTAGMADCFADSDAARYTFKVTKKLPGMTMSPNPDNVGRIEFKYPSDSDYIVAEDIFRDNVKVEFVQYKSFMDYTVVDEQLYESTSTPYALANLYRARFVADGYEPGDFGYYGNTRGTLRQPQITVDGVALDLSHAFQNYKVKEGSSVVIRHDNVTDGHGALDILGNINCTFEGFEPEDYVEDAENLSCSFTIPESGISTRAISKGEVKIYCSPLDSRQHFAPSLYTILTVESDTPTGVDDLISDPGEGAVKIFTIDGMPVSGENLCPGVYIVVRNGKAEKRYIK